MVEFGNLETGLSRTLPTDDLGRYCVAGLQPGRYQARALLEGFRAEMRGPIRLTVGREVVINFVVETVREFQVLVGNHSAEFGRAAGGIINAVTRSGTNELHGSVFEFHRNDNLDARNFFDAREKPELKRNQFGFTVGCSRFDQAPPRSLAPAQRARLRRRAGGIHLLARRADARGLLGGKDRSQLYR